MRLDNDFSIAQVQMHYKSLLLSSKELPLAIQVQVSHQFRNQAINWINSDWLSSEPLGSAIS